MSDSAGIPLFVMPWNVGLVAVTQEVTYLIVDRNTADEKSRHFLENLLFSPTGQESNVEELAHFYGITELRYFLYILYVCSVSIPKIRTRRLTES